MKIQVKLDPNDPRQKRVIEYLELQGFRSGMPKRLIIEGAERLMSGNDYHQPQHKVEHQAPQQAPVTTVEQDSDEIDWSSFQSQY